MNLIDFRPNQNQTDKNTSKKDCNLIKYTYHWVHGYLASKVTHQVAHLYMTVLTSLVHQSLLHVMKSSDFAAIFLRVKIQNIINVQ